MKRFFTHIYFLLAALFMVVCQSEEANAMSPVDNASTGSAQAPNGNTKTLIVYYSYTGNTEEIVNDLRTLINADVIEVEPVNKNLDYAANNYAIGTEQLNKINANPDSESSYPAIEASPILSQGEGLKKYNTIIIATPLWWSQMASNMQTFLFKYGKEMEGKNIGLIASSASSGISGVEADAKCLVPDGIFMNKSLWINSSRHAQRKSLLEQWLKDVGYNDNPSTGSGQAQNDNSMNLTVNNHTMKVKLADNAATEALIEKLKEAPISYTAHDYGGFEKVGSLGFSLPSSDTYITTEPGDIMLYTSNQLCIFFDSNSWEYTRIGKIEGMSALQLKDGFETGEISITLSLDNTAGIVSASVNKASTKAIYDINGRLLTEEPSAGMYIKEGKTIVK